MLRKKKRVKLRRKLCRLLIIFVIFIIVILGICLLIIKYNDKEELPQSDIIANEKEEDNVEENKK